MDKILEQVRSIEKHLNASGFKIDVANGEKFFWIYKGSKVYARTENQETKGLNGRYGPILNLNLNGEDMFNPSNLNYIRTSLGLKKILDENHIPYGICDLQKVRASLAKYHKNLGKILPRLQAIKE